MSNTTPEPDAKQAPVGLAGARKALILSTIQAVRPGNCSAVHLLLAELRGTVTRRELMRALDELAADGKITIKPYIGFGIGLEPVRRLPPWKVQP